MESVSNVPKDGMEVYVTRNVDVVSQTKKASYNATFQPENASMDVFLGGTVTFAKRNVILHVQMELAMFPLPFVTMGVFPGGLVPRATKCVTLHVSICHVAKTLIL